MDRSAEARLWWQSDDRSDVEDWFEGLSTVLPGGPGRLQRPTILAERTDVYLQDSAQTELGVKLRHAGEDRERLEVKSLVVVHQDAPPLGPVSLWVKSSSNALRLDPGTTISTYKSRRLRKYEWLGASLTEIELDSAEEPKNGSRPKEGCGLEFTRVRVAGSSALWWTLGFEAFGALDSIEHILRECIAMTAGHYPPPALTQAFAASYPEWLTGRASNSA